jgi:hypothetical protein
LYSIFSCPPTTKYFTNNYKGDSESPTYDLPTSKKNVYPERDLYHHAVTILMAIIATTLDASTSRLNLQSLRTNKGPESPNVKKVAAGIRLGLQLSPLSPLCAPSEMERGQNELQQRDCK